MTSPCHVTPASLLQDTEVWLSEKEREKLRFLLVANKQAMESVEVSLSKDLG